jgi:hypothetical protein
MVEGSVTWQAFSTMFAPTFPDTHNNALWGVRCRPFGVIGRRPSGGIARRPAGGVKRAGCLLDEVA